jgi:hypothetical protein
MLLNRRSRGRPGYGCTAFEAFGNPGPLNWLPTCLSSVWAAPLGGSEHRMPVSNPLI